MILEFPHQYATLSVQCSPLAKNPPGSVDTTWGIFRLGFSAFTSPTKEKRVAVQFNRLWTMDCGLLAITLCLKFQLPVVLLQFARQYGQAEGFGQVVIHPYFKGLFLIIFKSIR